MATLQKIRNRGKLLVIIVGLALLAFILGDFLTSGQTLFGNGNTIAKVGGTKIDAIEFQKRYEQISAEIQKQEQNVDQAIVQQQVLEQMISELLIDGEVEANAIFVSDKELTEAMTGKNANMMVVQFAQQMGTESPAQLYDLLFNPTKYGATEQQVAEAKAQWEQLKDEVYKNMRYNKLQAMIIGGLQANKLDKQEIFAENAVSNKILFVKKDYASIKDSEFEVTDADIKAQYEKDKYRYKLDEEIRQIHYIAVDVVPSQSDLDKAAATIAEAIDSLKAAPGIDNIRNNSELVINEGKVRASDIRETDVKNFVTAAAVGQVSEPKFESNVYSLVKLNGKSSAIDSVLVNVVGVQGNLQLQDSVLALLNGGKTMEEVSKMNGVDVQEAQWQVILNLPDSISNKLVNAGAGFFKLNGSAQGAFLCQVKEKKAPKTIYDIAEVTYKVYPSAETVDGLRAKLQDFIVKNNDTKSFKENAVKAGYQTIASTVSPSTPQIDRIQSTRKAIQWLFEAKVGDVSPIYDKDNNNKMLVVALDAIYDGEYAPVSDTQINAIEKIKALNEKKATSILGDIENVKGDLNAYAAKLGAKVDTTDITFGQPFIPKVGMSESALIGRASVAQVGGVQPPVKGESGVFVYQVIEQSKTPRTPEDADAVRQFTATRGSGVVMQNALAILRKATKVEKDLIKFF